VQIDWTTLAAPCLVKKMAFAAAIG
jgi:hypothetical protein